MVEVKRCKVGVFWEVWINEIHVYSANDEGIAHRIAGSISPEKWPAAWDTIHETMH